MGTGQVLQRWGGDGDRYCRMVGDGISYCPLQLSVLRHGINGSDGA